jgi:AcrR family transcriptional regulator
LGQREQNKQERRQRIQRATLDILAEKGFDRATTREIAARAGVAAGTLFLYAEDKVDLFLMSLNDELDQLNEAALDSGRPLLDQIITFLRPRYSFWARHPDLYRAATGDKSAYTAAETNRALASSIGRRAHTQQKLSDILRRHETQGGAWSGIDIDGLARILLDIYLSELRFWLSSDQPEVEDGLDKLRYLIGIVLSSISKDRAE